MDVLKMIQKSDLENPEINSLFEEMKYKNENLYKQIMRVLNKENGGIRKDILGFFYENMDAIKDGQISFHFGTMASNPNLGPSYFEYVLNYFKNDPALDINDFMISFMSAIEKNISLVDIKNIFEKYKNDEVAVYEAFESYESNDNAVGQDEHHVLNTYDNHKTPGDVVNHNENDGNGMVNVFSDLLTVMSSAKGNEKDSIVIIQTKFNEMIMKLQESINDLNAFSGLILHEMETDKEEIVRLKAIYNIQQRVLTNQQQKMNEMRNEIAKLQVIVQDAEKLEMQRANINQKVKEIQAMTEKLYDGNYYDSEI